MARSNGLTLHATSDTRGTDGSLSLLVSCNETLSTKELEVAKNPVQMLEPNMSQLVMKLQQKLGTRRKVGVNFISHTRIG